MEGAIAALREVRQPNEIALVVNELTPESQSALMDGYAVAVISTPLRELCRDMVELMVGSLRDTGHGMPAQHFLPARIDLAENI